MDKRILYFYNIEDFKTLKDHPLIDGRPIISVTQLLVTLEFTAEYIEEIRENIIDLTVLSTYSSPQRMMEQFIPLINAGFIFIANIKDEELLEEELRFCFDEFLLIGTDIKRTKNQPKNVKKITDLKGGHLNTFKTSFRNNLYGHGKFKDDFEKQIDTFRIFNKLGEHKILSLFLLGESGVGKTEVARAIHKSLGGKKSIAQVNFGNYSDNTSLNSLIGSSRGYIGSDDGEIFIRVRKSDTGIILIDEFEKGNPTVFNFFLSALETGILTNSLGKDIDINGYIIVFTSNISKEDFKTKISPELRSRFDYKCRFSLLYDDDKFKYTNFRIDNIIKNFENEFKEKLPLDVKDEIFRNIYIPQFKNMRDLNKEVKSKFIDYLETLSDFEYN